MSGAPGPSAAREDTGTWCCGLCRAVWQKWVRGPWSLHRINDTETPCNTCSRIAAAGYVDRFVDIYDAQWSGDAMLTRAQHRECIRSVVAAVRTEATPPVDLSALRGVAPGLRLASEYHRKQATYGGASWELHARCRTAVDVALDLLVRAEGTWPNRTETSDEEGGR